ncbi:MAG: hypothetical protein DRP01_00315 [Archaeoglobales archaeon]|nr:MAG: hypothetical protein DRP01_00315 [Archaeoglobales archaeon]
MPHPFDIGDYGSSLMRGLSGFWLRFFRDTEDLEAYYQASEQYLGQVYLDLLSNVLSVSVVDTPIFNKEYWKLFLVGENEISFSQGLSVAENRYRYDMPGPIVDANVLQNTIFEPDITFERGVDFDTQDDDGYVRFMADPFREYFDITAQEWLPRPGLGWRWQTIEVGNNFVDLRRTAGEDWREDTDVKRGDTLRLLAYAGAQQQTGTTGQVLFLGGTSIFRDLATPAAFNETHVGDIIQVYEDPSSPDYIGYYVVKEVNPLSPTQAVLEEVYGAPQITSAATLYWRHYKGLYFDAFDEDYEIDYIRNEFLVGNSDAPYTLQYDAPIVYAVVRDPADNDEVGVTLSPYPTATFVGHKHLVPGSVKVFASRNDGFAVEEGVDYTIDYLRGTVHPVQYLLPAPPGDLTQPDWSPTSPINKCSYQYKEEVLLGAGGNVSEQTEGQVRQISLWVPEVSVDRFLLYENFGYLLNRFAASSEAYKAFLRGIMYLYVSGPIIYRINAALNVAAGFPVISSDGEILLGYDNGMYGEGADGQIFAGTDQFTTPSYTFTELDVGGHVVFPDPANDANRGSFRILECIDANTVSLESEFGLANEGPPLNWEVTRTNTKVVSTKTAAGRTKDYVYPYDVTMLDLVLDEDNYDVLVLNAFDYLTEAFNVVDYIEDPQWWVNKYVPDILWRNQSAARRLASDELFPNIIGAPDDAQIGDPGLFIGADDEGNTYTPIDPYTTLPTDIYRHTAAFMLFDRYLKFHMFYIGIDNSVDLDTQFLEDLEELILVVKPSYTYPYVEPGDAFFDTGTLWDTFVHHITMDWTGVNGDNVQVADDATWVIGGPFSIGDYFRYVTYTGQPTGQPSPPAAVFTLPVGANERVLVLRFNATVDGGTREPLEGVDYTFDYDPMSPTKWQVTLIGTSVWDGASILSFEALVIDMTNISLGLPNTVIGYTPLSVGITSPGYVRETLAPIPNITEFVDRALSLRIDANYPMGVSYTY